MPKVLTTNRNNCHRSNERIPPAVITASAAGDATSIDPTATSHDFDEFTSSSFLEFLNKERECCFNGGSSKDASDITDDDAESIFQEVNRLSDNTDTRSVDEILREAELLINKQNSIVVNEMIKKTDALASSNGGLHLNLKFAPTKCLDPGRDGNARKMLNGIAKSPNRLRVVTSSPSRQTATVVTSPNENSAASTKVQQQPQRNNFENFVDNLMTDSIISEESTPKDMRNFTVNERDMTDNEEGDDDATDTLEDITECIDTLELHVDECPPGGKHLDGNNCSTNDNNNYNAPTSPPSTLELNAKFQRRSSQHHENTYQTQQSHALKGNSSPRPRLMNYNATRDEQDMMGKRLNQTTTESTDTTSHYYSCYDQIDSSNQTNRPVSPSRLHHIRTDSSTPFTSRHKTFCDKSTNSSPKHFITTMSSPIESISAITREHILKHEIEQLQEKLKDTEERLQSLRIQHDSLSQLHRDLRENNTHLQEESEILKLDVQHLNECANILRSELHSARNDRNEALDLQRVLQQELEDGRSDRKREQEQKEKDTKTIQDLQRQCREMERILMRKHPDSVSALIVASKNPGNSSGSSHSQDSHNSRKLLEQRIAQLEADAKEQDAKAQKILANVQARFNSVQSKYETHIADLETQVLSLQEINTKLNEKIESQIRTLDYFVAKKSEKFYNNYTQTEDIPEREMRMVSSHTQTMQKVNNHYHCSTPAAVAVGTNTIPTATQTASTSTNSTANSTPNTSRPNSKQSGIRKPTASSTSSHCVGGGSGGGGCGGSSVKLPFSQSDSTISAYHAAAKEDAHLLATIRGMRVDLAIKDKAMQRLTRELDECKKTIRKLQKEKDVLKADKSHSASSAAASSSRKTFDANHLADQSHDSQALKEALNKIKLLEQDYKALHDKRLQDLKTLQTAHERELASCHETVRILQQRLTERDEAFATQKRRKIPVDYYALKAKVSSLERRHSEREERLHMLVEALSKGRLNGALDDLLSDNNNH